MRHPDGVGARSEGDVVGVGEGVEGGGNGRNTPPQNDHSAVFPCGWWMRRFGKRLVNEMPHVIIRKLFSRW